MMALPETTQRVERSTADVYNAQIAARTLETVRQSAEHPETIDRRLQQLDREWDIERTLEANAASLSLLGLALGAGVDRRFFALPAVVTAFLLQHALQGWCPPLPVLRRLGFRTQSEIDHERYALKALRGDFDGVELGSATSPDLAADRALERARS